MKSRLPINLNPSNEAANEKVEIKKNSLVRNIDSLKQYFAFCLKGLVYQAFFVLYCNKICKTV